MNDSLSNIKCYTVSIKGTRPLLMHNGRLAYPRDEYAKKIKEITDKKKKTEADEDEIARLEWYGGVYYNDTSGIHMPSKNVVGVFKNAAKGKKLGQQFKRGFLIIEFELPLMFPDRGKSLDQLWESNKYANIQMVRIKMNKVPRCRPIFTEWALDFTIQYDAEILNDDEVRWCLDASSRYGLGDYNEYYGKFEITKYQEI